MQHNIKEAQGLHGEKYNYSNVNYINNTTKIEIICKTHGVYYTTPKIHLQGYNCPKCGTSFKINTDSFVEKSKKIHGDKYDYSKSVYKNAFTKLIIICPKHGEFKTTGRNHHYKGYGCVKCRYEVPVHNKSNTKEFILKATAIHGDKYDYSEVQYDSFPKHVIIICKKHGKFSQRAGSHLNGHGCRKCGASTGEKLVNTILTNYNINFVHQKIFKDCINPKTNGKLKFDFYLPDINACIEFDGYQHFAPVKYWGGNAALEKTQFRDQVKNDYCTNNNISLLRIKYNENVEKVVNNFLFSGATSN